MHHRFLITLASGALLVATGCSHNPQPAAKPAPAPARTARTATASRTSSVAGPSTANAPAFAEELITRTNAERHAAHLVPYTRSINLMHAAELQAAQMARTGKLEHDLPGTTYPTLGSRLAAVQYPMRAAGENIGEGYRSPTAAVSAWMSSAGHRANILSANYTEIGTAMSMGSDGSVYWVQVFARPR